MIFLIVCISWNNKKCFWYYWCTVQTWSWIVNWKHAKVGAGSLQIHMADVVFLVRGTEM